MQIITRLADIFTFVQHRNWTQSIKLFEQSLQSYLQELFHFCRLARIRFGSEVHLNAIYHYTYQKIKLFNNNKMSQYLHLQGSPQNAQLLSTAKKRTMKLINKNILEQNLIAHSFKQKNKNKNRQAKGVRLQEIQHAMKEPIINVAVNYGVKNGKNQVLNQYRKSSMEDKNQENQMNSFQRMLSRHRKSRNYSEQSKRVTFVDFKKRRFDKTSFDFRPIKSKSQQRQRSKTQETSKNIVSFQRTGFPKQLSELKQEIRELVSSKQNRKKPSITLPASIIPLESNISTFTNNLNQTIMNSQISYLGQNSYERRQLFKGSKCQSIKDYIEEINQVITYADEIMQEEGNLDLIDQAELKKKESKKLTYYRKYWPEYKRYTLNLRAKQEDQESAKFFNSFSQSDLKLDDDLQKLVNTIKMDLNHQQSQMNRQIAIKQKNAIQERYKYKIDIQRENYKRNIKSFIKCKKQYKIQRRREEVRANGIIRLKKATRPQKLIRKIQEDENQN